ncbi:DedA family protein [Piscinibacterium candidicorallinum]|uniref:DedA family protein n=1 Tax=Piscinibacterium candidicorallinum TaxID=1793872 RepID=A0ABV7GWW8_9BURK
MEFLTEALRWVLELDKHIGGFWAQYGLWLYVLVFCIVFAETGLVVTPWLPGDSLLFVLGALAAAGGPNVWMLIAILIVAAILGNTSNYWIGRWLGPRVFHYEHTRLLSKDVLMRTHSFYEKHGGITIVVSRFLPLIRTFAPFVAGIGSMPHHRFQLFSITGGIAWVCVFVGAGYFFGSIPVVKNNLPLVIVGVIFISFLPLAFEALRTWLEKRKAR